MAANVFSTAFRSTAPLEDLRTQLGPLAELPGTWQGKGFSLVALPKPGAVSSKDGTEVYFVMLNSTIETLGFAEIGGQIPDRGFQQEDIFFYGLTYVQRVSDAVTSGLLHVEPGMWLNLPATTAPTAGPSIVRLSTIPHGDSLLAQGSASTASKPTIPVISSAPLDENTKQPLTDPDYLAPYIIAALPPGIPAEAVSNPNVVLQEAIQSQDILETTVLDVSTTTEIGGSTGGIDNIPFVVTNANATKMDATFWIEKVLHPDGERTFMQLQYSQTVMLTFGTVDWPHISVATLVKQ